MRWVLAGSRYRLHRRENPISNAVREGGEVFCSSHLLYFPWIGNSVKPCPRCRGPMPVPFPAQSFNSATSNVRNECSCIVRRVLETNVTDFCYRSAVLEGNRGIASC